MKRVLLLVGAALSAFYTLGALVKFVAALAAQNADTTANVSEIAASVVPICIGAIIFIACGNALRRKPPTSD